MTKEQTHCSVEECQSPVLAKGLCRPHYLRGRKAALTRSRDVLANPADSDDVLVDTPKPDPLPPPYPGFEEFPCDSSDERGFAKTMANLATMLLNEKPDHPNRDKVKEMIKEHTQVAEMDDQHLLAHRLHRANPLNKLTQDEKLHCIRTLPLSIVHKLFPHV